MGTVVGLGEATYLLLLWDFMTRYGECIQVASPPPRRVSSNTIRGGNKILF